MNRAGPQSSKTNTAGNFSKSRPQLTLDQMGEQYPAMGQGSRAVSNVSDSGMMLAGDGESCALTVCAPQVIRRTKAMLTIQTTARVAHDRCIDLHVPTTLEEGEYQVLVVLEEAGHRPHRPLTFSNHRLGTSNSETFCREDIYGDDGR
jgi:hypothetical protein